MHSVYDLSFWKISYCHLEFLHFRCLSTLPPQSALCILLNYPICLRHIHSKQIFTQTDKLNPLVQKLKHFCSYDPNTVGLIIH